LGTAVLTGPRTHNFEDIFRVLIAAQGEGLVHTTQELAALAGRLIANPDLARSLGEKARTAAAGLSGALNKSVDLAEDLLAHHACA
jgi:3-deoxy-D-manno-octulosonic-acid transferase